MRIFAYVSSRRGQNSSTLMVADQLIKGIIEHCETNIEYELITANELSIHNCRGCNNCFKTGICPLDNIDKFNNIKKKLIEADMIILGSPVYACMVNGDMKTFIDRISYLLHLIPLAGKPAVVITTSANSGIKESSGYLKNIAEILGAHIISNIKVAYPDIPYLLSNKELNKGFLDNHISNIIEYIDNQKQIPSTDFHERYFSSCKRFYSIPQKTDYSEAKYWKKSGLLECSNFEDVLHLIRQTPNLLSSLIEDTF
ncbi:Fe-S cluster protein [Clostridium zeae]|uniref:Fe-S cluster protein n=1 Tax=Clostridium zeae TaxID=2759022 RepID=A0ABQ1ED56_9CLOT|nr:flavodoxin family protein [Clostridium zeae]GFZ32679.1 Fe-S cluster protein [Clostridium zeae]